MNSSDEEEEAKKCEEPAAEIEVVDTWFPDQAFAANKNILMEVEELEEKIFAASLQVKVRFMDIFIYYEHCVLVDRYDVI